MTVGSKVQVSCRRRAAALMAALTLATVGLGVVAAPTVSAGAPASCINGSTPALGSAVTCSDPGSTVVIVPPDATGVLVYVVGAGGGAGGAGAAYEGLNTGGDADGVSGLLALPAETALLSVIVGSGGTGSNVTAGGGGGGSGVVALNAFSVLVAKLVIAGGGGGASRNANGADARADGESAGGWWGGFAADGPDGGSGGVANINGSDGESDDPTSGTLAMGGQGAIDAGADADEGGAGGDGGGGYGGGGGGGISNSSIGGIVPDVAGGGGGGSSFQSIYLADSSISTRAGTGGQLVSGVAQDGSDGWVTLTFLGDPGAPTGASATAGAGQATVAFTAPTNDGGSPITGYTVTSAPGGLTKSCSSSPCTITGLTNGTAYTFTVRASSLAGDSAESAASLPVTPATTPDAPTVSATPGDSQFLVFHPEPFNGGSPITHYEFSIDGGTTFSTLATTKTAGVVSGGVTGLSNGTPYSVRVRAVNIMGRGSASESVTVTPAVAPGAPTAVSATAGDGLAVVSFSAPASHGGSPVTGYTVTSSPGRTTVSCAGSPCTITGLTNGTAYTFTVHATNPAGYSTESAPSTAVTPVVTVAAPVVTAGTSSVTVSWPQSADGMVTGYTAFAQPGPASCTTTSVRVTSCVIGVTAGQPYSFVVVAHSPGGDSASSPPSGTVAGFSPQVPDTAPLAAPATLTTSNGLLATVSPSQRITVVGTGFLAYSSVAVLLYGTPVVLGTAVADRNGDVAALVTMPAGPAAGSHDLVASGVDPQGALRFLRMPVTIAAPPAPANSSGTTAMTVVEAGEDIDGTSFDAGADSGATLAHTGVQLLPMVYPAMGLVLAGCLCIVLGYRRRGVPGTEPVRTVSAFATGR